VTAVHQCQLNVQSPGQLMSNSDSWAVNWHTTHYSWSCGFGWCLAEGYR